VDLLQYSPIITETWKQYDRPQKIKDFQNMVPPEWWKLKLDDVMKLAMNGDTDAYRKIVGDLDMEVDELLLGDFTDRADLFKGILNLCQKMVSSHSSRTLDDRTTNVGSAEAIAGASGLVFCPEPTIKGKGKVVYAKGNQVPRLACLALVESSLASRYRNELLINQPGLQRIRESMAAIISPHVKPTSITMPGTEEPIEIEHYFFSDGINAEEEPSFFLDEFDEVNDIDRDQLFGPKSLNMNELGKLRDRLSSDICRNPILRLGMTGNGVYARVATAAEILLHVSMFLVSIDSSRLIYLRRLSMSFCTSIKHAQSRSVMLMRILTMGALSQESI
jgi:hypothetical protein